MVIDCYLPSFFCQDEISQTFRSDHVSESSFENDYNTYLRNISYRISKQNLKSAAVKNWTQNAMWAENNVQNSGQMLSKKSIFCAAD